MFNVIAKMWIWCLFILHVTHHAFLYAISGFPVYCLFCCFLYDIEECALHVLACVVKFTLFLALSPPLPQVLQGTTMQQLQQMQVAQSQATPITVNTSNPSKWPLIFPPKPLLWNSKELFHGFFSWQLNKNCISKHNTSAKISLFHILYIKQCSEQKQRVW